MKKATVSTIKLNNLNHKFIMRVFICFVLAFLIFSVQSKAQTTSSSLPDHPRILWTETDQAKYQKALEKNVQLKQLHQKAIAIADQMVRLKPVRYDKVGRRLLGVSRTCLKRVSLLAYAYRMTGEPKYLEKTKEEMLAAAAFQDWNPSHFLDVGEMTMALAIGYDWLYHALGANDKKRIEQAIIEKGLRPAMPEDQWWLTTDNNWNQVCNTGISLGAWAVYESYSDTAAYLIERAKKQLRIPEKVYDPDGAYPEGAGYWVYGTMFHTVFYETVWKIEGKENYPASEGFMKSGAYNLHVYGPAGYFNYADNGLGKGFTPPLYWYAKTLKQPSLLYHQISFIDDLIAGKEIVKAEGSGDRLFPLVLIWLAGFDSFSFPVPAQLDWTGKGITPVSLHRSGWDDQARFFGVKGGRGNANHGHMDIGTFVFDANGVRWAMDLGSHPYHELEKLGMNIWGKTQDAERWTIFRYNNLSHNTLVVNDRLQKVDGYGEIIRHSDREDFKHAVLDLSAPYEGQLQKAKRGMALVNQDYLLIRDEIQNVDQPSAVRWAMVTHDSVDIVDRQTARIQKDGQTLIFKVIQPTRTELAIFSTTPPNDFELRNPDTKMIGFEVELKPNEKQTLLVALFPSQVIQLEQKLKKMKLKKW